MPLFLEKNKVDKKFINAIRVLNVYNKRVNTFPIATVGSKQDHESSFLLSLSLSLSLIELLIKK